MPKLRLSEDHVYTLGKRVLPGVTEIVKAAGLSGLEGIPEHQLKKAADRGTDVHRACELLDGKRLDWGTVSEEVAGYVYSWMAFKEGMQVEIVQNEQVAYHPTLMYAGKPDRVVRRRGVLGVLDIKSGAAMRSHHLQAEAYKRLVDVAPGWIVYLRADGKMPVVDGPVYDVAAWMAFQAALNVWNWKQGGK